MQRGSPCADHHTHTRHTGDRGGISLTDDQRSSRDAQTQTAGKVRVDHGVGPSYTPLWDGRGNLHPRYQIPSFLSNAASNAAHVNDMKRFFTTEDSFLGSEARIWYCDASYRL